MLCPFCKKAQAYETDLETIRNKTHEVFRTRKCERCGFEFNTREIPYKLDKNKKWFTPISEKLEKFDKNLKKTKVDEIINDYLKDIKDIKSNNEHIFYGDNIFFDHKERVRVDRVRNLIINIFGDDIIKDLKKDIEDLESKDNPNVIYKDWYKNSIG